jgi:large subunit ribosomal protein L24
LSKNGGSSSSSKPSKVRQKMHSFSPKKASASLPVAAFSTDLKAKYAKNSVRVRIGDSVKLVRGEYSGIEGKVQKVFPRDGLVTVEGIHREKIAGGNTPVKLHTSNLVVTALNLSDKWRRNAIEGTQ